MAICNKCRHVYNETVHTSCPECARAARGGMPRGPAPRTVVEDDGFPPQARPAIAAPGGGVASTIIGDRQPAQQLAAAPPWSPPPSRGGVRPPSPRTIIDEPDNSYGFERLMGFLVIVNSREDDVYRYCRLRKGVNHLGRFGNRAHIELRDSDTSAEHAILLCSDQRTRIIDLDSTNGLFVNGERTDLANLQTGDRIRVGQTHLIYVAFGYVADD